MPVPEAEYRFHDTRKWRFDWAWLGHKVAMEIDGGIYMSRGGAHRSVTGIKRDIEKFNQATCLGWRIIRRTPEDVLKLETVELIRKVMLL